MKKLISILIALTMLMSIIPVAFAEGEVSEGKTYTFKGDVSGKNIPLIKSASDVASNADYAIDYTIKCVINGTTYYLHKTYVDYGTRGWRFLDATNDVLVEAADSSANYLRIQTSGYLQMNKITNVSTAVAITLQAPSESGFYIPILDWGCGSKSQTIDSLYMDAFSTEQTDINDYMIDENKIEVDHSATEYDFTDTGKAAVYSAPGDEIAVAVKGAKNKSYKYYSITLNPILNPDMTTTVNDANSVALDLTDTDTTNDTASASVVVSGKTVVDSTETAITDMPVSNNFITYKSSSDAVATVSADGTVTAIGAGEAKIWAESKDGLVKSKEVTVTVTGEEESTEDADITNAFTLTDSEETGYNISVSATEYVKDETSVDITATATENEDGTYKMSAPETKGYTFLYWAKGLSATKKIVSLSSEFDYAPASNESNILIAVYEKADAEETENKAEFYNANGQLIPSDNGTFPELPFMAGYGKASGWTCYNDGKVYDGTETLSPVGTMIFVANYKETPDKVKVNGEDVVYGSKVTFTAAPESGKTFKCWVKEVNGVSEIVSIDSEYSFLAWEDCTVTEVDADSFAYNGNRMKIILDTFSVDEKTAIMAEFIGLDNAVEKGIMFGTNKIAMTRPGSQFTVMADEGGTFTGYAIVGNKTDGYTLITDGELTVPAQ